MNIKTALCIAFICQFGSSQATELSDSFTKNLRWSLDLASRVLYQPQTDESAYIQMAGLDIHSVIGDKQGDLGTFVLQTYLTRIDNLNPHPAHFDDENDWAIDIRTFAFNYTGLTGYAPNVLIGHMVLPYGLEESIDTSGQLLDYNHRSNLGLKTDWGIALNNQHRSFEYDLSYTFGNKQKLKMTNNHVISGRIGTPSHANHIVGVSIYEAHLDQVKRRKIAIDGQIYRQLWGYLGEFSIGRQNNNTTKDATFEVNWRNSEQTLLLYTQALHFSKAGSPSQQFMINGLLFEPDKHWSVGLKFRQAFKRDGNGQKSTLLGFQLRYRF